MRRWLKWIGLGLIGILIILQFFRPEQNDGPVNPEMDMLTVAAPPDEIAKLIRNACYDCHSNQTNYPWYEKVSPVSWYLHRHITEGKEELNFSEYGSLEQADKIKLLTDFYDVLESGIMPLPSYRLIHKEARLSADEVEELIDWSDLQALKVMRE